MLRLCVSAWTCRRPRSEHCQSRIFASDLPESSVLFNLVSRTTQCRPRASRVPLFPQEEFFSRVFLQWCAGRRLLPLGGRSTRRSLLLPSCTVGRGSCRILSPLCSSE